MAAPVPPPPAPAPSPATPAPIAAAAPTTKPLFPTLTSTSPAPASSNPFQFSFPSNTATAKPATNTGGTDGSKPFSGFSFGNGGPKVAAVAPASAPAPSSATAGEEEDGAPLEKQEIVEKEVNPEEDCIREARAKKYMLVDSEWKDLGVGVVRLMKNNKDQSKRRLVMRNSVGKVVMNFSIGKGMTFDKTLSKKGAYIRFVAPDEGELRKFMLKLKSECMETFHKTLLDLAS
eukprot:CAMPEP_0172522766 /NCGR_PEP_ID=MMETSP1066-20121228/293304_1 /TAXON_ID=671091 /ORGANISM="Coscinodiscus wailesii, Strain CCMP2513" /LENGTH=231 /DNA_ID=CAMNT_0013305797 /DNA_START=753 /DNA_END=1448 /DNA_ORIENTATION=-